MDETKCKENVRVRGVNWPTYRQCSRKIWKDGYCKQHHPNSVEKRRKAQEKRWEEDRKRSPWYLLQKAKERISELETEIAKLKGESSND